MSVLAGTAAAWLLYRLAAHLPARIRLPRGGAFVWAPTLILWTALAALMGWAAPRAAYLWVLPLLAAATPLALGGASRGAVLLAVCPGPGHRVGVVDTRRRLDAWLSRRAAGHVPCRRARVDIAVLAAAGSPDACAADGVLAGRQRVAAAAICHTGLACRHGVVDRLGVPGASLHTGSARADGTARGGRWRRPAHLDRAGGCRQRTGPRSGLGRSGPDTGRLRARAARAIHRRRAVRLSGHDARGANRPAAAPVPRAPRRRARSGWR